MTISELERAWRTLRLSGMGATLHARPLAVVSHDMDCIKAFSWRVQDELDRRYGLAAREDALRIGKSGVGKSHLGSGLGHALIEAGYRALYLRRSELVQRLQAALAKLDRHDLLADLSSVRKDQAATSMRSELIAERHERRSLLITANQPFSPWEQVSPDHGLTVAAIDRLLHHATSKAAIRQSRMVPAAESSPEAQP